MAEKPTWMSNVPKGCQLCSLPFHNVMYDSVTRQGRGPWGLLCTNCWTIQNGKIGVGFAQKYEYKEIDGVKAWYKIS